MPSESSPQQRPLYPAPYLRPPSHSSPTRRRRPSLTATQPRKKRKNIPSDVDIAEIRRKSDTRWKEQDLEYLSSALASGHSYESIARHLVRSIASVHVRATRLRKAQKAHNGKMEQSESVPIRTRKIGRPIGSGQQHQHHHIQQQHDDPSDGSETSSTSSASPLSLIESLSALQHPRPLWAATNTPYFPSNDINHRILPTSGDEDYLQHLKQKRLLEQQRGIYNTATFMNAWQHSFPQPYDSVSQLPQQLQQSLVAQSNFMQQQQQQYQSSSSSSSSSTSASTNISPSASPLPDTSSQDIGLNVPSHVTMITINNSNSVLGNQQHQQNTSFNTFPNNNGYEYQQQPQSQEQSQDIEQNQQPQQQQQAQQLSHQFLHPHTSASAAAALAQFPFSHYGQAFAAAASHQQNLLAQYQHAVNHGTVPSNEHISIGAPIFATPDFNFLQHAIST